MPLAAPCRGWLRATPAFVVECICGGRFTPMCGEWNGRSVDLSRSPMAMHRFHSPSSHDDRPAHHRCVQARPECQPCPRRPNPHPWTQCGWPFRWKTRHPQCYRASRSFARCTVSGAKTREATECRWATHRGNLRGVCPPAVDALKRLLAGKFPEVLPEWLRLRVHLGTDRARQDSARPACRRHKNPELRAAVPALAGERGLWIARRRQGSFLVDVELLWSTKTPGRTANPPDPLAWATSRHAFPDPPQAAAAEISSHWAGEDAPMREAILHIAKDDPQACDQCMAGRPRLEGPSAGGPRFRRNGAALSLPQSEFQKRAVARVRERVKIERRFLSRIIAINPPDFRFPSVMGGRRHRGKAPPGTGEKAWWRRQIIALVPLDRSPEILGIGGGNLFSTAIDKDWQDTLLLGWIDSRAPYATPFTGSALSSLLSHF